MKMDGTMTAQGKSLLARARTAGEKELRDEIVMFYYAQYRTQDGAWKTLADITGLGERTVQRIVQRCWEGWKEGGMMARLQEQEAKLADVKFEHRRSLAQELYDLAARSVVMANVKLPTATAKEAATIAAVSIDKALLLTGQPTSRVARTDERQMTDEELEAELSRLVKSGKVVEMETAAAREQKGG